jgi:hypothetical protein
MAKKSTFGLRSRICWIKLGLMPSRYSFPVLVFLILAQGFALASVDPEFEKMATEST